MDALTALRAQLNATLAAADGGKLSLNDFVVKVRTGGLDMATYCCFLLPQQLNEELASECCIV